MAMQSAQSRVAAAREQAGARLAAAQERSVVVRTASFAFVRDRRVAGGILAGALAYRLFAALLPLALLAAVVTGWAGGRDGHGLDDAAKEIGVSGVLVQSVSGSTRLEESQRWVVLGFALFAVMVSAYAAVKAIRAAYALAWDLPIQRWGRGVGAAGMLIGGVVAVVALWGLSSWARAHSGVGGTLFTVLVAAAGFFAVCLVASMRLPHRPVHWTALIPGALLMAVALQVMHVVTAIWLVHKVERASATYGALGGAFAILVWLYLLSRVIVGAAVLNATLAGVEPGRGSSIARGSPQD
jgi:uncharacterized BrkB/YihY/UPF0761 family membrane protein